jgi:hypothetical protein
MSGKRKPVKRTAPSLIAAVLASDRAKIGRALKREREGKGGFQIPPEGAVYNRPAGTKRVQARPAGPIDPHAVVSPGSGVEIFPAVRPPTRRIQSHVGPSPQASKITRRRRI